MVLPRKGDRFERSEVPSICIIGVLAIGRGVPPSQGIEVLETTLFDCVPCSSPDFLQWQGVVWIAFRSYSVLPMVNERCRSGPQLAVVAYSPVLTDVQLHAKLLTQLGVCYL